MTRNPKKDQKNQLISKALRYLSYRHRSRHELENYLAKKTDDQSLIDQTLEYIDEADLIDDAKFVEILIRNRINKCKGTRIIQLELQKKYKIPSKVYKPLIQAIDQDKLIESAVRYLEKQVRKITKYPEKQQTFKAKQLLYNRGFSSGVSRDAIDEFFSRE